ncbi:MAG: hypothetical protein A3F42_08385 [Gammaproteobacteria bacterium RIFCSPHIGHO2_12_FULL_37_34]|nr:MAG: hypothetical protein A3F42_08385 [Gammaproteobacteria bacterium RIFCSPHIGHO2_12_FULL_37_34]
MSFSVSEVVVVLLVALLVIKPEQLPDVAFTLGRFTQSVRRALLKIKQEVNGFIEPTEKSDERK